MKLNLYNITEEFNALEEMLIEDGGEITETHDQLAGMVRGLLTQKTDNFVSFVQKLEDEAELASQHIKRLQAYKKARENAVERLKEYAGFCLDEIGENKIKGTLGEIAIRKPSMIVEVLDESLVDAMYLKTKVEINKAAIKEALKSGLEVSGAKMSEGKRSIQFKIKSV